MWWWSQLGVAMCGDQWQRAWSGCHDGRDWRGKGVVIGVVGRSLDVVMVGFGRCTDRSGGVA